METLDPCSNVTRTVRAVAAKVRKETHEIQHIYIVLRGVEEDKKVI